VTIHLWISKRRLEFFSGNEVNTGNYQLSLLAISELSGLIAKVGLGFHILTLAHDELRFEVAVV
jgi:hypothetical protein